MIVLALVRSDLAVTAVAATVSATTMVTVHRVTPQQDLSDEEFIMPQKWKMRSGKHNKPIQPALLKEVLTSPQWQIRQNHGKTGEQMGDQNFKFMISVLYADHGC